MRGSLDNFLCILYGGPLRSVSLLTSYRGPLRSVSSQTIWGPSQTCLFAYYNMGAPSDQFFRLLYGASPRSVSSLTIWGSLDFFHFLRAKLSLGGPHIFEFPGWGQVPPLAPPPPSGRP